MLVPKLRADFTHSFEGQSLIGKLQHAQVDREIGSQTIRDAGATASLQLGPGADGPGLVFNLLVAAIFAVSGEALMMWARGLRINA